MKQDHLNLFIADGLFLDLLLSSGLGYLFSLGQNTREQKLERRPWELGRVPFSRCGPQRSD